MKAALSARGVLHLTTSLFTHHNKLRSWQTSLRDLSGSRLQVRGHCVQQDASEFVEPKKQIVGQDDLPCTVLCR